MKFLFNRRVQLLVGLVYALLLVLILSPSASVQVGSGLRLGGDDTSSAPDGFNVYAGSGARIPSNSAATPGVVLAPGGTAGSAVSDRVGKENAEPVRPRWAVLEATTSLRIVTWDSISRAGWRCCCSEKPRPRVAWKACAIGPLCRTEATWQLLAPRASSARAPLPPLAGPACLPRTRGDAGGTRSGHE